ncbi:MAG: PIG-L family deacetylase [Acidimicrobiia bacterium]
MAGTLVCFHAHPDDETIATGGVIAQAASTGRRVVLVLATRGELGEVPDGFLDPGETLTDRRVDEVTRAAEILGIARVEFLGYHDSGMAGLPENDAPGSFWSADVQEAADRLASILRDEDAEVLVVYDENGGYGHPDHIQVHRVGVRAAEIAGTPRVYETTMNADAIRRMMKAHAAELADSGIEMPDGVTDPEDIKIGVPEALITTTVDVREFADLKRAALAEHASQVGESHFFLAMPPEFFREAFGIEWFIKRGAPSDLRETSLFEGVGSPGA